MEPTAMPMPAAAWTTSIASSMMAVGARSVGLQNGVRWTPMRTGVFYPQLEAPDGDARRALENPRGPLRGPAAGLGRLRRRAGRGLPAGSAPPNPARGPRAGAPPR